jgi:hypothetical protein
LTAAARVITATYCWVAAISRLRGLPIIEVRDWIETAVLRSDKLDSRRCMRFFVFFAGRGDVLYVRRSLEVWPNDLAIRLTKDFCTERKNIGADELDRLDVTARYIRDFIRPTAVEPVLSLRNWCVNNGCGSDVTASAVCRGVDSRDRIALP